MASLPSIFQHSLHPGGRGVARSGRSLTNLSAFLPDDGRNVVGGRNKKDGYDVTIVFHTIETPNECKIRVATNGVLATGVVIPSMNIARIFAHKQDRTGSSKWVIDGQLYAKSSSGALLRVFCL